MENIYYVIKRIKDNTYFAGQGTFSNGFHGATIYKDINQAKKTCDRYSNIWKEDFEIITIRIEPICKTFNNKEEINFEANPEIRYTPEQVRKMSSIEVKTNYKAIINSMKYWH